MIHTGMYAFQETQCNLRWPSLMPLSWCLHCNCKSTSVRLKYFWGSNMPMPFKMLSQGWTGWLSRQRFLLQSLTTWALLIPRTVMVKGEPSLLKAIFLPLYVCYGMPPQPIAGNNDHPKKQNLQKHHSSSSHFSAGPNYQVGKELFKQISNDLCHLLTLKPGRLPTYSKKASNCVCHA